MRRLPFPKSGYAHVLVHSQTGTIHLDCAGYMGQVTRCGRVLGARVGDIFPLFKATLRLLNPETTRPCKDCWLIEEEEE